MPSSKQVSRTRDSAQISVPTDTGVPRVRNPRSRRPSSSQRSSPSRVPLRAGSRYSLHQKTLYKPILQAGSPSNFHSSSRRKKSLGPRSLLLSSRSKVKLEVRSLRSHLLSTFRQGSHCKAPPIISSIRCCLRQNRRCKTTIIHASRPTTPHQSSRCKRALKVGKSCSRYKQTPRGSNRNSLGPSSLFKPTVRASKLSKRHNPFSKASKII